MPVSVVVGGQFGSEGKGKVALELARRDPTVSIAVRPGGTNSGHTGYTKDGRRVVLRQLPAAAIDGDIKVVLPAGSYIDVQLLEREIAELRLPADKIAIDPRAHVITPAHIAWERSQGLVENISSTGSGTGAAVLARLGRCAGALPAALLASEDHRLLRYLKDVPSLLATAIRRGDRVLIEGTQGFGLSPLHGEAWPKCTSRDTTAAAFLSETGLSPVLVDDIVLVIRCHPIRVAGDSGPLVGETKWSAIARKAGNITKDLTEFTSVTNKARRVGVFDPHVVRQAIDTNLPHRVALNHLDYIDWNCRGGRVTKKAATFIEHVEQELGRHVDLVGTSERSLLELDRKALA